MRPQPPTHSPTGSLPVSASPRKPAQYQPERKSMSILRTLLPKPHNPLPCKHLHHIPESEKMSTLPNTMTTSPQSPRGSKTFGHLWTPLPTPKSTTT